jgi:hypothetical protein
MMNPEVLSTALRLLSGHSFDTATSHRTTFQIPIPRVLHILGSQYLQDLLNAILDGIRRIAHIVDDHI